VNGAEHGARFGPTMATTPSSQYSQKLRGRLLGAISRSSFVRNSYAGCSRLPFLGSIVRKAAGTVVPTGERICVRIPRGLGKGLWLWIDPRFEERLLNGDYEPQVQEVLAGSLKPGDCCFDVGAHIGFFSLLAARLVGESGKVVAFEPDPINAAVLRANAINNGMPQIHLVEAAVWSSSGPVQFAGVEAASSRVDGRVEQVANHGRSQITVEGIRLDDYYSRHELPPPVLLKVDVEGAETEVVYGATHLFRDIRPTLLCEVHSDENQAKLEKWFEEKNYSIRWIPGHARLPVYLLAASRRPLGDLGGLG
jgi:FkbM family methyltransferase